MVKVSKKRALGKEDSSLCNICGIGAIIGVLTYMIRSEDKVIPELLSGIMVSPAVGLIGHKIYSHYKDDFRKTYLKSRAFFKGYDFKDIGKRLY